MFNTPKCVCGQGFAADPTEGAYNTPPDCLAGFQGRLCDRGGKRRKEGREEGVPHFFFSNLTTHN